MRWGRLSHRPCWRRQSSRGSSCGEAQRPERRPARRETTRPYGRSGGWSTSWLQTGLRARLPRRLYEGGQGMTVASASTRTAIAAILGTLLVVGFGIAGFALGRSDHTTRTVVEADTQIAKTRAFAAASATSYRTSRRDGYARGLQQGEHRGRSAGKTAGRRKGLVVTAQKASAASTGCPSGLVPEGTQACVKPGGQSAGCGGDPYSTPTRTGGCIGPGHPPSSAATPETCPSGQVPVGQTGACAPAEGGSEANTPSVNSPEGRRALESEECQGEPAPPPGYEGPVQC